LARDRNHDESVIFVRLACDGANPMNCEHLENPFLTPSVSRVQFSGCNCIENLQQRVNGSIIAHLYIVDVIIWRVSKCQNAIATGDNIHWRVPSKSWIMWSFVIEKEF
jgi:hypothetical protein